MAAADTCVFNGIEEPITGAEVQGDDIGNMDAKWAHLFQNVYNHVLIVNSSVSNSKGTYTGSSWDNNGENLFTTGFNWRDKSTLGKWAWASSIVGKENYKKDQFDKNFTTDIAPFEFTYSQEGLPFSYQVLPLEDVKEVVTEKSGCGVIDMSSAEWVQTAYLADADYSAVNAAIDKANALNAADYVDFSAVTNAINAVETGLKSDNQDKVNAMALAIEDAIKALVPVDNTAGDVYEKVETTGDAAEAVSDTAISADAASDSTQTGDMNHMMIYAMAALMAGLAMAGAMAIKKRRS